MKYNSQRDPIPQIARECVEKLFAAIDADMDGYISLSELTDYVKKVDLSNFTPEMVDEVFYEITRKRGIVHKEQLESPLSQDEVYNCCISQII